MSDYENSEDEFYNTRKAFDVELRKDFDPNKIPETGEEYLQKVIYERKQHKSLITAEIDPSKIKARTPLELHNSRLFVTPDGLLPSKQWQIDKLEDFTNFRKFIATKLPEEEPIIGITEATLKDEGFLNKFLNEGPKFSDVIRYTQEAKIRLLDLFSKNLSLNENLGAWIYAILALLEKPLSPDFCHSLRIFVKSCIELRNKQEENADCSSLNLFICIIGRYYEQLDFADP